VNNVYERVSLLNIVAGMHYTAPTPGLALTFDEGSRTGDKVCFEIQTTEDLAFNKDRLFRINVELEQLSSFSAVLLESSIYVHIVNDDTGEYS
jgi:hypothetical protein